MTALKRMVFIAALFLSPSAVFSATYYIDSARGSDSWSGYYSEPAGNPATNGPWQSLAKLSSFPLKPGDTVALRCGAKWTETLKIPASGTSTAGINVTSYPADCQGSPPTIEGEYAVPQHAWSKHTSNIYKADISSINLLRNSDFEAGLPGWKVWSAKNDAQLGMSTDCGTAGSNCAVLTGSTFGSSLAVSNNFGIVGRASYQLKLRFKAASGIQVGFYLRRDSSPWDSVGVSRLVSGNGAWQQITIPFVATAQIENARLDIDIPKGEKLAFDDVRIEFQFPSPKAARVGNLALIPAHHPNRGFNTQEPGSLYLRTAADSNVVAIPSGGSGSTYITRGPDLVLPPGGALKAGVGISIRPNEWTLDERKIASVSGMQVVLNEPTSYPVQKDWGYFFTGALWMLDEPSEWYFDAANKVIYTGESLDPASAQVLYLSSLDTCIDAAAKQYVRISNIAVRGCLTGATIERSNAVELSNIWIQDISGVGIYAPGTTSAKLVRMKIERVGRGALLGVVPNIAPANSLTLADSSISNSGVVLDNKNVISLPAPTGGAVIAGIGANVSRNIIRGTAFNGIVVHKSSLVENNLIEDACLILGDCAGIYMFESGSVSIKGNTIRRVVSSSEGMPISRAALAAGIYLDELSNSSTVAHNTVAEAYHGIFLHNAYDNTLESNTIYANSKSQLWLHEDTRRKDYGGDLRGNYIVGNKVFSLVPSSPVVHSTSITDTTRFASYDQNRYSSLVSPRIVGESWPSGSASYVFPEWQARGHDAGGNVVNAIGYASYKILGGNRIWNGSLSSGTTGWTSWNATAPYAAKKVVTCGDTLCLELTAGGSTSEVASPPFSVTENAWYKITFDIRASSNGYAMFAMLQRGGGSIYGYEPLSIVEPITSGQSLSRVSFITKAMKTVYANDPNTGELGARILFKGLLPGQTVYLANVEIVEITPSEASLQTRLLSNPGTDTASYECPDDHTEPELCGRYIDFVTNSPVAWPVSLGVHESRIIYTRDSSLADTDGDGIMDIQDVCPSTSQGVGVNASGCGLGQ